MKVNNGASHPLVGSAGRHGDSPLPAPAAPAASPPTVRAAAARPRRMRQFTLLSLAASALVLGCASVPSSQWRMEPSYRVQGTGTSAAQGYLALARQYEGEERALQAIDAYRKATLAAPDDADMHNALGVALARQAQFGPAVLALRRAVALAPERAQLLNNLGYALLLDGRMEEARAIIRLTLAMDPQHAQASRNLAYADAQLGTTRVAVAPAAVVAAPVDVVAASMAPVVAAQVAVATPVVQVPVLVPVAAATPAQPVAAVTPDAQRTQAAAAPPAVVAAVVAAPPAATPAAPQAPLPAAATLAMAPPVSLDGVSVEIINGNGIGGTATRLRGWLREHGIAVGRLANLVPFNSPQTQVLYRPGKAEQARSMALRLPVVAHVLPAPAGSNRADLRVLIGHDVIYSAGCSELAVCATPERLTTAAARPQ